MSSINYGSHDQSQYVQCRHGGYDNGCHMAVPTVLAQNVRKNHKEKKPHVKDPSLVCVCVTKPMGGSRHGMGVG